MPDTSELSEARRTLLEKYVRGDVPQIAVATRAVTQYAEADVATPRECVVTIQIGGSKRPFFFLQRTNWDRTNHFMRSSLIVLMGCRFRPNSKL